MPLSAGSDCPGSVSEVPNPGVNHRGTALLDRGSHHIVLHRSAGLNDRDNPRLDRDLHAIGERKEGITRQH